MVGHEQSGAGEKEEQCDSGKKKNGDKGENSQWKGKRRNEVKVLWRKMRVICRWKVEDEERDDRVGRH